MLYWNLILIFVEFTRVSATNVINGSRESLGLVLLEGDSTIVITPKYSIEENHSAYDAHEANTVLTSLTDQSHESASKLEGHQNFTCSLRDPQGSPLVKMSYPATSFGIGVFGNLCAILFLWKSKQRSDRKQHIFYTLVMTLAWCDLISSVATSPVTFSAYMNGQCLLELGGEGLCKYSGFAMIFSGIGSVAIVFAMSLERLIAIRHPYFYKTDITTKKTRICLLLIILGFALFCCLPLVGFGEIAQQFPGSWCFLDWKSLAPKHQVYNFIFAIVGIIMMVGTIACNGFVIIGINTANRSMPNRNSLRNNQEKQMLFLLVVMTLVFVVCYLPLLVSIVYIQAYTIVTYGTGNDTPSWHLIAVRLAAVNPIIDPWVYILCRRTVLEKGFRIVKLLVTCKCDKEEFREIFLNRREFRRRHSQRASRNMNSVSTQPLNLHLDNNTDTSLTNLPKLCSTREDSETVDSATPP